ncbi:zinc metalloprotease ZmpB isoform X2 [Larimichthys crocea]|nr:zinc metalloprotease ZmpB isoform X2 [Larimichthys crocea]
MGNLYAKQKKNEDTENGAAKEAAANEATDFNHGTANDLSGNLKNTSQGPGPTQGISHQIEPNNDNEAVLTSMLQVPTGDAQNREQSLNKAVNKSQDVDPVKIDPYIFTAERHASSANTPGRDMKIQTGGNDDLSVFFKHKPPAPVKQKTKPVQHQKRTTAPGQEQSKPVQQHTKPVQQQQNTTAAVQQQTKPVQQQTKPVQQQTKPVQEQAKPVQEQAKQVQQQTKPVQQQTKPVQQQAKPVQQQIKPVQQQAKPVQQQAKPVQQQIKPVQQQTKHVQEQAKPVQEQTKPVQQQTKPVQEQAKPVQQQIKPVQEQIILVQQQTKPVQQQAKPVQQQTKPVQQQTILVQHQTIPVQQQTKPVQQQTIPVQHQTKTPSPVLHVTVPQQRPTAAPQQTAQTVPPCDMATADSAYTSQVATHGLCRHGLHQVEHSFQLPASRMQASVHRLYSDVVRGVPTENLPRGTKAQIKMLRQTTDKTHNTAEQSTATGPGMAEVPPESHQSESQVNIQALHQVIEHCFILTSTILTKRQREPAEVTVAIEQESSEQQYNSGVEEITIQTHNEPQQVSKSNKADDDTNGNASSCLLKVNVEALEPQVPAVEGMPSTAPNNATDHPTTAAAETHVKSGLDPVSVPQDTDVKPETLNKNQPDEKTRNVTLNAEMNAKDGQVVKEEQEPAVHTEGRRHPFKVNQSCPYDVKRNTGKGLPPNVQKWCDEPPYHLCEPPWVTTARLAAFLALTKAQKEKEDPPQ